jgi:hypothetical protein
MLVIFQIQRETKEIPHTLLQNAQMAVRYSTTNHPSLSFRTLSEAEGGRNLLGSFAVSLWHSRA